jgi:hypothetical protein
MSTKIDIEDEYYCCHLSHCHRTRKILFVTKSWVKNAISVSARFRSIPYKEDIIMWCFCSLEFTRNYSLLVSGILLVFMGVLAVQILYYIRLCEYHRYTILLCYLKYPWKMHFIFL